MILRQLQEYAETRLTKELAPPGYLRKNIKGFICLNISGQFEGFVSSEGTELAVPHVGRSGKAIRACLLADTGEYVLGVPSLPERQSKVVTYHRAFQAEIQQCAETTKDEKLIAIANFLKNLNKDQLNQIVSNDFDANHIITFKIDNLIIANAEENHLHIHNYWFSRVDALKSKGKKTSNKPQMTCLVSGGIGPVERRMPFMIKGIRGGNSSGTALVSANAKAFTSYGLEESLTSPISLDSADKFLKALNSL